MKEIGNYFIKMKLKLYNKIGDFKVLEKVEKDIKNVNEI